MKFELQDRLQNDHNYKQQYANNLMNLWIYAYRLLFLWYFKGAFFISLSLLFSEAIGFHLAVSSQMKMLHHSIKQHLIITLTSNY